MISNRLINYIISHEGLRLYPYFDDYAGTPDRIEYSIGYGHQIQPTELYLYKGITAPQARALLIKDIINADKAVRAYIKKPLTPKQRDALTNLVYAVGAGGARYVFNAINYKLPKKEIIKIWKNTGIRWQGKTIPGLQKMRAYEISWYYSDQYYYPIILAGACLAIFGIYRNYQKTKI